MGNTTSNGIDVIGYGSLLSEPFARKVAPSTENFRLVTVSGYMRIFNKAGIVFFEKYGSKIGDLDIASCATRPSHDHVMMCTAFRCNEKDFGVLYEQEHRFKWIEVPFIASDGTEGTGRMCTEYSDKEYLLNKCVTPSEYYRRVGQFYPGKIWRDDILPFPRYLELCLTAAASHGPAVLDNFLDTSFLTDGKTSIRTYMKSDPDRSVLLNRIMTSDISRGAA